MLFNVLRNNTDPSGQSCDCYALNPRQIVFITPPYVKDPAIRVLASERRRAREPANIFDPWGTSYNVDIDGSYNNQITNPYTADTGAGPATTDDWRNRLVFG